MMGLLVTRTVVRGSREKGAPHSGMSTEEGSSDYWNNRDPFKKENTTSACDALLIKTKLRWHAEGHENAQGKRRVTRRTIINSGKIILDMFQLKVKVF